MAELLAKQRQEKEPLIHCGVYLDIATADTEKPRPKMLDCQILLVSPSNS